MVVNADFNKCNLVIKTVNKTLDEGHWYCNLTKDLSQRERGDPSTDVAKPPRASWYEVTMYRLKVASQTKMVISGPKDKKVCGTFLIFIQKKYVVSIKIKEKCGFFVQHSCLKNQRKGVRFAFLIAMHALD